MFGKKIRITRELLIRIKDAVDNAGYSSVEEFIETAIERELEKIEPDSELTSEQEETLRGRLRGLGYIK